MAEKSTHFRLGFFISHKHEIYTVRSLDESIPIPEFFTQHKSARQWIERRGQLAVGVLSRLHCFP
jgi:hypothetical protein